MRYLSVCSGIEAATVAWHPRGWTPVAFSEIEAFPSAVLKHHYPQVPNLGDMTRYREWGLTRGSVDLVVGGTPCQSFSVAGLRKGMADPRGNLALVFLGLADHLRPDWIIWENVPGVLSSNKGRDFGAFLGGLAELGYGWSYRVLDAQYVRVDGFGRAVPQRRRRVFVVGHLGDWRRAAAVLFERESVSGNPPPRRQAGEGIASDAAPSLTASGRGVERTGESRGQDPVIPELIYAPSGADAILASAHKGIGHNREENIVATVYHETGKGWWTEGAGLRANPGGMPENIVTHSLRADGFDASGDGTGRGTPLIPVPIDLRCTSRGEKMTNNRAPDAASGGPPGTGIGMPGDPAFTVSERGQAVAFTNRGQETGGSAERLRAASHGAIPMISHSVVSNGDAHSGFRDEHGLVPQGYAVRRLTPTECARLQGFPDDYLDILYRGKPAKDGPKYKALGNSFATNVVRWLGRRIQMVEDAMREAAERAA